MDPATHMLISYDLPVILTATLAAVACALVGNFLVLRRMSLMGDAISHAVLPGLVVAFLITGSRETLPMLLGAVAAGLAAVIIVELVRRIGRVEPGAAIGVAFSVLFALGVLLIRRYANDVDLDPNCVLNGQVEQVFWTPPQDWSAFWSWSTFAGSATNDGLPPQLVVLSIITIVCALFVTFLFKELRIVAFDPGLATSLGFNADVLHLVLMGLVAVAVVASFEAVGSVLVIAMLICPPATARMLTDRLIHQVLASVVIAIATAGTGYALAANAPAVFGTEKSLSIAGMMAAVGGAFLALSIVASPRHGVVALALRRTRHTIDILREDLVAMLFRIEEGSARGEDVTLNADGACEALASGIQGRGRTLARFALRAATGNGEVTADTDGALQLTDKGRARAARLVRTHRLWESFLVRELGLRPDHVHRTAMDLEHITDERMEQELLVDGEAPDVDPHDKPIPEA